jgi:uncharacterized membrane protein YvlD (DUF360 family)
LVNGFSFFLASKVVPGFTVASFWWAVLAAVLVSVLSAFIGKFCKDNKRR